jgi:hypothetical protein
MIKPNKAYLHSEAWASLKVDNPWPIQTSVIQAEWTLVILD